MDLGRIKSTPDRMPCIVEAVKYLCGGRTDEVLTRIKLRPLMFNEFIDGMDADHDTETDNMGGAYATKKLKCKDMIFPNGNGSPHFGIPC